MNDLLTSVTAGPAALKSSGQKSPVNNGHESALEMKRKEYEKVAEEMESLFAFQLLKVMRECSSTLSTEQKGMGNDTYMSLFDMEVSKLMAKKGTGLKEAIVSWLERSPGSVPQQRIQEKNGG